jgi:GNAT superfamily N-acetyltransferase
MELNPRAPAHVHGEISSHLLSKSSWRDFERLFAANGGVWGGCWCMFFHTTGRFDAKAYSKNRDTKLRLTREGKAHGTIVFCGDDPVGWCQFGPKEELSRIDRKRGYKSTSPDAWRITCLFIAPGHRRSGLASFAVVQSLKAMKEAGVRAVEAYPVIGVRSATLLWSGTPGLFEKAGFTRAGPLGKGSSIYMRRLSRP